MRWRSPGSSDEPGSCTEEEDGSPQSISLSVSEVQTAVLVEMRLENPTQPEMGQKTRSLSVQPVIHRQPGSEGEPQARSQPAQPVTPIRPMEKSLARPGRSSIPPKPVLKMIAKREAKQEEVKSERLKGGRSRFGIHTG